MTSVGAHLRELRERRGVPLTEIARMTRVASRYLEALEADAFDALPPPVFTRGFIRAYCQALAEPPEEALACYDARPGAPPPAAPRPVSPAPGRAAGEPRSRSAVVASLVLLVILGMALFTVALLRQPRERTERAVGEARQDAPLSPAVSAAPEPAVIQPSGTAAPAAASSPARTPASSAAPSPPAAASPSAPPAAPQASTATRPPAGAPPPKAATASAPTATENPPAAPPPAATSTAPPRPAPAPVASTPASPAVAATPSAPARAPLETVVGAVGSPYHLVARTSETTWIRVRTEDGRSSEENVPAGETREWVSDRPFVLTIGNAGGVSFELNGRALPPLGAKGTVIPRLVLPPEAR